MAAGFPFSLFTIALALAQTPDKKTSPLITIDGSQTPDRIPDWILWRETFRLAQLMSERNPGSVEELWMGRLHLSKGQLNDLIGHAVELRDMESSLDDQVRALKASQKATRNSRRIKLQQFQHNEESRMLELRDKLRARVGRDAFERIQSYARLHIAPGLKVGRLAAH